MAVPTKHIPLPIEYIEVEDVEVKKRRTTKRIVLNMIAVILLYPFETDVIQELQFRVVNADNDSPMTNITVTQKWANYGVELSEHVDEAQTDQEGFVTLPARTFRSPLFLRTIAPLFNITRYGRNARWGSQAFVTAYVSDAEWGFVHIFPDQPVPQQIVVNKSTRK